MRSKLYLNELARERCTAGGVQTRRAHSGRAAGALLLALGAVACSAPEHAHARSAPGRRSALSRPAAQPAAFAEQAAEEPAEEHGPQAPGGDVELARAVSAALARHPELKALDREHAARLAEARQAARRRNPSVQLDVEDFLGSGPFTNIDSTQWTLWYAQPIERGGSRDARTRAAEVEVDLAELDRALLANEVAVRATAAFWRALAAQNELELSRSVERMAREFHATVKERVAAGKVSPVEEAKYAVAWASARLDRTAAERASETARLDLARTWAGDAEFGDVVGEFGAVVAPEPLERLRERVADGARTHRLESEALRNRAAVERARAAARSPWSLQLGVRRFEAGNDSAGVLSFSAPLPVFDRGHDAITAARERLRRGEHDLETTRLQLDEQLARAWARMRVAHEEVAALEDGVLEEARWVFEAVDEGYREGKFELLDVLDAQRTHFDLRARHMRAVASYHLATTEIDYLIGGTLP